VQEFEKIEKTDCFYKTDCHIRTFSKGKSEGFPSADNTSVIAFLMKK